METEVSPVGLPQSDPDVWQGTLTPHVIAVIPNETYASYSYPVPDIVLATSVLQTFIAVLGIIFNLLLITTISLGNERQDSSSVTYMLNLACSDCAFLLTVPFHVVHHLKHAWNFGDFMCKFTKFMTYLNFLVSPLLLMVMSVDRFLAVNRATTSTRYRTARTARIVCACVWFISVVCVLPSAMFHTVENMVFCNPRFPDAAGMERLNEQFNVSHLNSNVSTYDMGVYCRYSGAYGSRSFKIWTICNAFYNFALPLAVITGCYFAILCKLYRSNGLNTNATERRAERQTAIRRKVTLMVANLIMVYIICYAPYYVWNVAKIFTIKVPYPSVCSHMRRFTNTMTFVNSAVNPVIYGFTSGTFSTKIRLAYTRIVQRRSMQAVGRPHTQRSVINLSLKRGNRLTVKVPRKRTLSNSMTRDRAVSPIQQTKTSCL